MELNNRINEILKDFPYLCEINLERKIEGDNCGGYELVLGFCNFPNFYIEDKLLILFSDVRNLEIRNLDGLWNSHIIIRDLSKNQLENINYFVTEDEENMFSFYCSSINLVTNDIM